MNIKSLISLALGVLVFISATSANADVIDFENYVSGTPINEQYLGSGITFSDALDGDAFTSQIVNENGNNALRPASPNNEIYFLFNSPVFSVSASVFEYLTAPPQEPESVYLVAYGDTNNQLNTQDIVVHSTDMWSQISFSSNTSISAIHLYGTQEFKLDDIEFKSGPTPSAVPLPGSILLFGTALLGFLGFSRRKVNV